MERRNLLRYPAPNSKVRFAVKLSTISSLRQLLTSPQFSFRGDQLQGIAQILGELVEEERRLFELSRGPQVSLKEVAKRSGSAPNEAPVHPSSAAELPADLSGLQLGV